MTPQSLSIADLKDWKQDFKYENGNYINICIFCKHEFKGHKRRVVCRQCSDERNLTPPTEPKTEEK